jgi:hypothetical protein
MPPTPKGEFLEDLFEVQDIINKIRKEETILNFINEF